ncbi:MAG TPA: hypothetical protein PKA64_05510, partial [Myxococcota bacterium]|nr:hypothetical protein [Myxococcota bacterium]
PRHYGETCAADEDCAKGLACARDRTCRSPGDPGTAPEGAECLVSGECAFGLVCSSGRLCAEEGAPGTAAHGEPCQGGDDCRAGLYCHGEACAGLEVPTWGGAECPDPALETGPFRVYFEIPGDDPLPDFYRLPYPNDARVRADRTIDLAGHPSPGELIPELGDPVGAMLRAASVVTTGFGPNQAVFLRFSDSPDSDSLSIGMPGQGTISVVDLTSTSDIYGQLEAFRYELHAERTPYICHNWLAVHALDGHPWRPGHTYGVLISRGVTDDRGNPIEQAPDFRTAIAPARPTDQRLAGVWSDYSPLRLWLQTAGLSPDQIAGGTVFTLQDPAAEVERLREAVAEEPPPALISPALCGEGADPLADPGDPTRGCQTRPDDPWIELQATVRLPQYQAGSPPFKDAVDGGGIDLTNSSTPPLRHDDVAVSLTLPAGAPMPPAGWPVILYGHGTGGNYTSAIREGLTAALTEVTLDDGTVERFAILGFDALMHGPRAHPEGWRDAWLEIDPEAYAPDLLFFNPLNPRAARDNALQAAADLWSLVDLLRDLDLPAGSSPTGERVRVDRSRIYYLGHSQGGVVGATFLAHEDGVAAAVLSGAGGLTADALVEKTSPHDLPALLAVGLADPRVTRTHPLVNIAQQLAERSDGVNHAGSVIRHPIDGDGPRHVLQVFGVGDTYSPDSTQYALARALGLQQVPGSSQPLDVLTAISLPVSGNLAGTTGVVMLYQAQGEDAHFVLFDRADTMHHVATFFGTAARDGAPTITPL